MNWLFFIAKILCVLGLAILIYVLSKHLFKKIHSVYWEYRKECE